MVAHLLEQVVLGLICRLVYLGHLGLKLARRWRDHGLYGMLGPEPVCWAWLQNKASKSTRLLSVVWKLRFTIG